MGLYLTSFVSGASIMALEMLGFRLFPAYFGYSIHVWGSLLGVIMVALTGGYYAGGLLADRRPDAAVLYLMVLIAAGYDLLVLLTYPTIMRFSMRLDVVGGSLLATLVLFVVPMTALGTVSPLIIRLLARERSVGTVAGKISAISTLGSIAGTFLTTFYLIPTIGIRASFTASFVILAVVAGLGFLGLGLRGGTRRALAPASS